jgi:hypothetical protein
MPEGAPASNGTSSCNRGPPPEENERNNEMQRSEAYLARTGSLGDGGAGGGTRRNPKGAGRPSIGLDKFVRVVRVPTYTCNDTCIALSGRVQRHL